MYSMPITIGMWITPIELETLKIDQIINTLYKHEIDKASVFTFMNYCYFKPTDRFYEKLLIKPKFKGKDYLKEFVNEKIHSDLAKNFIYGINGKTKLRLGESYVLENNDVIKIVSAIKGK